MEDAQYAAILIFMIAFIGMSCNWFIVIFSFRTQSMKTAFGRFLSFQALGEAIHLTLFTFFVSPMLFFGMESWTPAPAKVGHILLICYDICIYCHLAISLNRLVAIVTPFRQDKIFSKTNTFIIISVCYMVAMFPSFYYYVIADCALLFEINMWHFEFIHTDECDVIMWYADYVKYNVIVVIIVIIDLTALSRVHSFNKAMQNVTGNTRRKKELNFLKQACLQAVVFVMELISYFVIAPHFTDRWFIFLSTTVAWVCVHTSDGIITIFFNQDLYRHVSQQVVSFFNKGVTNGTSQQYEQRTITGTGASAAGNNHHSLHETVA